MSDFSQTIVDKIPITACLISLASNHQPTHYLSQTLHNFKKTFELADMAVSDIIISQDKNTQQASLIYHNQMAVLYFKNPFWLSDLIKATKHIEVILDRKKYKKPIVTLDIDIIAFATQLPDMAIKLVEIAVLDYQENALQWFIICRRFPLADYEISGLKNLVSHHQLEDTFYQQLAK